MGTDADDHHHCSSESASWYRADRIDLGMNGVHATRQPTKTRMVAAGKAILTNCDDLASLEDHGNVRVVRVFCRVATLLSHDIRIDMAVEPGWQSRHGGCMLGGGGLYAITF